MKLGTRAPALFIYAVSVLISPWVYAEVTADPSPAETHTTISWSGENGLVRLNGYRIVKTFNGVSTTISVGSSPHTFDNLTPGEYVFDVYADGEILEWRAGERFFVSATHHYGSVTVTAVSPAGVPTSISTPDTDSDGAFTVSWGAASGSVTHYKLEQQLNDQDWVQIYSGSSRSAQVSDLADGIYRYRVSACTAASCNPTYRTSGPTIVSNTPTSPVINAPAGDNDGNVAVSWSTVAGSALTYRLEAQKDGGSWRETYRGTGTSTIVNNLEDGIYGYRVRACNTVSTSTVCGDYGTSAESIVAIAPETPSSAQVTPSQTIERSNTVTWDPSASGVVDKYKIYRTINGINWTQVYEGMGSEVLEGGASKRQQTFSELPDGTYQYWVTACNSVASYDGCSENRATDNTSRIAFLATPKNLQVPSGSTDGNYAADWESGGGTVSYYTLQEKYNGTSWVALPDLTATSHSFSDKADGTYEYRVLACNEIDCTPFSASVSVLVLKLGTPGAIRGPGDLYEVDDFTLNWGDAPGTVDFYELQEQPVDGAWETVQSGLATTISFTDHHYGAYNYRVRACNEAGCSPFTSTETVKITITQPPQPAPAPFDAIANISSLVPQSDIDSTDRAGSISGSFRVSESGAATYNIPIPAAAGTAGVVPEVSLDYSSQGGNGLAGLGWSIGGLSQIARCRQTLHQDQQAKPITWGGEDRFCLDGQRLILISGRYGAANSTYKTELDTFAKIIAVGGSLGNPDYWKVERKDGSISTYGGTGNVNEEQEVRGDDGGLTSHVVNWALNSFADSVGNRIDYDYLDDADGHQIQRIKYAYGDSQSEGAEIEFRYEGRPDASQAYIAGYRIGNARRLKSVHSWNGGHLLRRYILTYEDVSGQSNESSKLLNIQECTATACLPNKTIFEWPELATGFLAGHSSRVLLNTQDDQAVSDYKPIDINGDGRMDLVWNAPDWDPDNDLQIHDQYGHFVIANETGGYGPIQQFYHDSGNTYAPFPLEVLDYNGDGRQDVAVYMATQWKIFLAEPYGSGNWKLSEYPIATPVTTETATFGDFNSDGMPDVAYIVDSKLRLRYLVRSEGVSPRASHIYQYGPEISLDVNTGFGKKKSFQSNADFNGDGIGDLVIQSSHKEYLDYRNETKYLYIDSETTLVSNGEGDYDVFAFSKRTSYNPTKRITRLVDLNGDGLTDEIIYTGSLFFFRLSTGTEFGPGVTIYGPTTTEAVAESLQIADYNRDGYPDLLWHETEDKQIKASLWDSKTARFGSAFSVRATDGNEDEANLFLDVSGDGLLDYVKMDGTWLSTYMAKGSGQPQNMITRIQNGLNAGTNITYKPLGISGHYARIDVGSSRECRVINKDTPEPELYCTIETNPGPFYEKINGGWDLPSGSTTLGKQMPVLELNGPIPIVTQIQSSAPTAADPDAESSISYYYGEAKIQAAGRGMLGFHTVKTVDEQSGVQTITTYRQDWPFIGYPLKTVTYTAEGIKLSESHNTWDIQGISDWSSSGDMASTFGTTSLGSLQLYIKRNTEKTYRLLDNGASQGEPLKTVTTENRYDGYGNAESVKVTTVGGGKRFQTVTTSHYTPPELDPVYALEKGRLSRTAVTHKRDEDGDGTYEKAITRTSAFGYYSSGPLRGILRTETVEPGTPFATTTTNAYDRFGNEIRAALTAGGVTRCDVNTSEYDTRGRYVDATYDCMGRKTTQVIARSVLGAPTEVRKYLDTNGVNASSTYFRYTPGGIRYFEADDTGAWESSTLHRNLSGLCPTGTVYYSRTRMAGGAEARKCFDNLGRSTATLKRGFDGRWIITEIEYDNRGRVTRQSEPHYLGGWGVYWADFSYDLLDRSTHTTLPDGSTSTNTYSGFTTVLVNALGQTKTEVRNAIGDLVRVTDHLSGSIRFQYDAQGNLIRTTDNLGNSTAISYDILGRKTGMIDPDKGTWSYSYNGFGELVEQTDAKGQRITMAYDDLGRMVSRQDYRPRSSQAGLGGFNRLIDMGSQSAGILKAVKRFGEKLTSRPSQNTKPMNQTGTTSSILVGNSTWIYDSAANGLGQLDHVQDSISGYMRAVQYDELGRASKTTTALDISGTGGLHYEKQTYDQYGRPFQVFDAARQMDEYSDNGVEYRYNGHGYRYALVDAVYVNGKPRSIYQRIREMDARGNVRSEALGNNTVTSRNFDPATGRIASITSTSAVGRYGDIQDLGFSWDPLGNLLGRADHSGNKNLTETYGYDGLNRLTTYQVAGQPAKTVAYDSIGNITYKSDVGDYSYGQSAGPHAVTTASGVSYQYDANGNNTGDSSGRIIQYTAFDKAEIISKDGHTTRFAYGPDRNRYKRTDSGADGTRTTYYLGNVEKITLPDGSRQVKRYIGGVVIETEDYGKNGALNGQEQHYTYKDHLGSIDVIADSTGVVTDELSFDPWGQRRSGLNWADLDAAQIIADYGLFTSLAPPTTRGFTGHEHLDEVGIINMNGRIYDPRLARFLQADPVLQMPDYTQSYNRYSYLFNNPLNATDPTGFRSKYLFTAIRIVVAVVINMACDGACPEVWAWAFATIGAVEAVANGGGIGDVLLGAATGAMMGAAGGSLAGGGFTVQTLGYGVVGGITTLMQGGKFGHGFISAYLGSAVGGSSWFRELKGAGAFLAKTILGGTISKATGGKFANGAVTAAFAFIASAGAQAGRKPTPQEVTYARMSNAVYDLTQADVDAGYQIDGYTLSDLTSDESGLKAALFVKGDSQVVAFAGTSPSSWANWKANLRQAFGLRSAQYEAGKAYAASLDGNVQFTGHSLGGGIASAAAIVTGNSATVFNAAGVHSNTLNGMSRANGSVTHFRSSFDVLQPINMLSPASVPGHQISLGAAGLHGMGSVCKAMGC